MTRPSVMRLCAGVVVATLTAGIALSAPPQPPPPVRLLSEAELQLLVGGACNNQDCGTVVCDPSAGGAGVACTYTNTNCAAISMTTCGKVITSSYARCRGSLNYNCSETSDVNCAQYYTGAKPPGQGGCGENDCGTAGSGCGPLRWNCTQNLCP